MKSRDPHITASSHRGAFTLLELIVVMIILCITAAMIAPSMRGFADGRKTKDAAAQLVALCHYARTQAITEGRVYRLNIDTTSRTCWLTTLGDGAVVRILNDHGQTLTMPPDTTVNWDSTIANSSEISQRGYIRFLPSGAQDIAAVIIAGATGPAMSVRCNSPTEPYHIATPAEIARR